MALTRTHQEHEEIPVQLSADEAFADVVAAFGRVGKIKGQQDKFLRVTGRVPSGALNMNPADVTVSVRANSNGTATIVLDATAQEGLIPQGTAAKAISRILDAI